MVYIILCESLESVGRFNIHSFLDPLPLSIFEWFNIHSFLDTPTP